MLFGALFIEKLQKRLPVYIVTLLKNSDKFIPTDSKYRAVFKYITDNPGCLFQINISLVMSILVIDLLEAITIKHTHSEYHRSFMFVKLRLHIANHYIERTPVTQGSQRISIGEIIET